MDQWLEHRSRYLHLLLEMEGLTKAQTCSMCTNAMEVKCSDCIGGNYFCKACCLQTHKRSPFHRMARWTGSHFAMTSLYALGFKLCLGHDGDPCSLTVEVSPYLVYMVFLSLKHVSREFRQHRIYMLKSQSPSELNLHHSDMCRRRVQIRSIRRVLIILPH